MQHFQWDFYRLNKFEVQHYYFVYFIEFGNISFVLVIFPLKEKQFSFL